MLIAVSCGQSARNSAERAAGGSSNGSTGGTAAGMASDGGAPIVNGGMGGAGEAGATTAGEGGEGGEGGDPTPGLTVVVGDVPISNEIVADGENFYFVTHPAYPTLEPGDIHRLPRNGVSSEVLVTSVGGPRADLQLYDGVLYYHSEYEVHAYDLATGTNSLLFSSTPEGGAIQSLRVGPAGIFWVVFVRDLFRRGFGPDDPVEPMANGDIEQIWKVETDEMIVRAAYGSIFTGIFDLASGELRSIAPPSSTWDHPFPLPPVDADWYYVLDKQGTHTEVHRYSRAGTVIDGMLFDPPTVMTSWELDTFAPLVLFDGKLIILMRDGNWYSVSTADGSQAKLPALAPCGFVFTNEAELFCAPDPFPHTVYRIEPEALAPPP